MLIQGARRLYECKAFAKPSASRMWFVHWLVGLAFYLAVSVALWIEGAGTTLTDRLKYRTPLIASRSPAVS